MVHLVGFHQWLAPDENSKKLSIKDCFLNLIWSLEYQVIPFGLTNILARF